jgi:hypothetical protein
VSACNRTHIAVLTELFRRPCYSVLGIKIVNGSVYSTTLKLNFNVSKTIISTAGHVGSRVNPKATWNLNVMFCRMTTRRQRHVTGCFASVLGYIVEIRLASISHTRALQCCVVNPHLPCLLHIHPIRGHAVA